MRGPARMVGVAVVAALVVAIPAFASSSHTVTSASTPARHAICKVGEHHPRGHRIRRCVVICESGARTVEPAATRVRIECACIVPATGATGARTSVVLCPLPPKPCTGVTGATGTTGSTTPVICGPCPLASTSAGRLQPRIVLPGCQPCPRPTGTTGATTTMCVPICALPTGATGATGATHAVIWCGPRIPLPCAPPPSQSLARPAGYACPMTAPKPAS